jgi:hypothetical protein
MQQWIVAGFVALICLAATPVAGPEAEWLLYPEGGLQYTLLKGGRPCMEFGVVAWGPGWQWFGFRGETDRDAEGRRTFAATSPIGGTDETISLRHTGEQDAEGEVVLSYELTAHRAARLTQVVVSVGLEGELFSPGQCTAVMDDSQRTDVPLPLGRGSIGEAVRSLIFQDAEGDRIELRMDPPRRVTMDGDARITLVGDTIGAGDVLRTDVRLALPGTARFYAAEEETWQRNDTFDWFPYPVGPEGVPIDLSFMNKDAEGNYVPAGVHGFLRVEGDRFVFEDGTPARFWGLNVTAGAALGSRERAAQLAERLARLGCNIVRLHHLDSWANPIIDYDHPDGTTQHLSPEGMRALDCTVYELKRRGIYVVLDPWVQRCFKEADGVKDYGHLGERGNFNLHPYIYFDERMQQLIQKQWAQVWSHVNEFTGLAYRDDPACVMTEAINEGLLIGLEDVRAPYREDVLEIYRQWAAENGGLPPEEAKLSSQNWGENNLRFFTHLHREFYRGAHGFFRRLGVRIPINATNWAHFTWVMAAQTELDFMDSHHYYGGDQIGPGHGLGGLWLNHPPDLPGTPFGKIAGFAAVGKPVASSECGNNPPKTYRAAYQLGLAAVAALQGWDSVTGYAYSQSGGPRGTLGAFEWESDPASVASVAAGALIFRRGDVAPARQTVVMRIPEEEVWTLRWQDGGARQYWNSAGFNAAIEQHKVVVALPGESVEELDAVDVLTPEAAYEYEHPNTELASDTGQLWRDWRLGLGTIDTPRTQAAYGKLGETGRSWQTADCTFDVSTPFAVTVLSSLTDEPIADSDRLLLIAVARAENTGMAFNMSRTRIAEDGDAPVIAEPVEGTVRFRTEHEALLLHPILADGTRGPAVPVPVQEGFAEVKLTPAARTVFYEIEPAGQVTPT